MNDIHGSDKQSKKGRVKAFWASLLALMPAPVALPLVAALTMSVAVGFTLWSGSGSSPFQKVPSGTVDISADPAVSALAMSGMAPGDSIVESVTVENSGSLPLRYALRTKLGTTGDHELASQLQLRVWQENAELDDDGTCQLVAPATLLYEAGPIAGSEDGRLFGDPATGAQPGDRSLPSGAREVLCFRVSLPKDVGNTSQLLTTTATLSFDAEHEPEN